MSVARLTEARLQSHIESGIAKVVGAKGAARLMAASESAPLPSSSRESRTAKVARLSRTARGRKRLEGVLTWDDVDRV